MADRTEPTVASFSSSRRSCACGDYQLADDDQLVELLGVIHGATACLRSS